MRLSFHENPQKSVPPPKSPRGDHGTAPQPRVPCSRQALPGAPSFRLDASRSPEAGGRDSSKKYPKLFIRFQCGRRNSSLRVCRTPEPTPTGNGRNSGPTDLRAQAERPGRRPPARPEPGPTRAGLPAPQTGGLGLGSHGLHPRGSQALGCQPADTHIYGPMAFVTMRAGEALLAKPDFWEKKSCLKPAASTPESLASPPDFRLASPHSLGSQLLPRSCLNRCGSSHQACCLGASCPMPQTHRPRALPSGVTLVSAPGHHLLQLPALQGSRRGRPCLHQPGARAEGGRQRPFQRQPPSAETEAGLEPSGR